MGISLLKFKLNFIHINRLKEVRFMREINKGDNIEDMTEEERKAFRLSLNPDTMGTDEDKYGGQSNDSD